jgi:hypothetical protein
MTFKKPGESKQNQPHETFRTATHITKEKPAHQQIFYKYFTHMKCKVEQRDNGTALVHLMMASSAETCIVRKMGRDECF